MVYLAIGLGTLLILSKSAFLWLNGSIAGSGISEGGELKKIYRYFKKSKTLNEMVFFQEITTLIIVFDFKKVLKILPKYYLDSKRFLFSRILLRDAVSVLVSTFSAF